MSQTGQSGAVLFSSREAGSVSISYSASVDDVVGVQVVGKLRFMEDRNCRFIECMFIVDNLTTRRVGNA